MSSRIPGRWIDTWAAQAKALHEQTDYAVMAEHPVLGVFELGCWMFGFDAYLYRLAGEPELVHVNTISADRCMPSFPP